jgi:hypothetical protein
MDDIKTYIQALFKQKIISISAGRENLFEEFIKDSTNISFVEQIIDIQLALMDNWKTKNRIYDILAQQITIPNARVGNPYHAEIDLQK